MRAVVHPITAFVPPLGWGKDTHAYLYKLPTSIYKYAPTQPSFLTNQAFRTASFVLGEQSRDGRLRLTAASPAF